VLGREATPAHLALQGRLFRDEGVRWRVRDAPDGIYYDLDLGRVCASYYDFDAWGGP